jgi:hypothetical protein
MRENAAHETVLNDACSSFGTLTSCATPSGWLKSPAAAAIFGDGIAVSWSAPPSTAEAWERRFWPANGVASGAGAAYAGRTPAPPRFDAAHARLLVAVDDHAHRGITQTKITNDLATVRSALVGAYDLTATFILRIRR